MASVIPNFNHNRFANTIGTLLVVGIGLIIIPLYSKVIGFNFVHILGIYLGISALSMCLDFGLIQRFIRMMSERSGQDINANEHDVLLKVSKVIFIRVIISGVPITCVTFKFLESMSDYIQNNLSSFIFILFLVFSALFRVLFSLIWSFYLSKNQHVKMNFLKVSYNVMIYFFPLLIYYKYNTIYLIFISQFFLQLAFLSIFYIYVKSSPWNPSKVDRLYMYKVFQFEDNFQKYLFFLNLVSIFTNYSDRFYLKLVLDEYAMGLHIYYVTINLAIMGIVAGIANTFYPSIVEAYAQKDFERFNVLLKRLSVNSITFSGIFILILFLVSKSEIKWFEILSLSHNEFPLYLFSALLNSCMLVVYFYQLCIRELKYALFYNCIALILSVPISIVLAAWFQLLGVAFSLLIVQLILICGALLILIVRYNNYFLVRLLSVPAASSLVLLIVYVGINVNRN